MRPEGCRRKEITASRRQHLLYNPIMKLEAEEAEQEEVDLLSLCGSIKPAIRGILIEDMAEAVQMAASEAQPAARIEEAPGDSTTL